MNYKFNIIDTQNNDHTTVIENALRSGAVIKWNGADKKDSINLIGNSLTLKIIAEKYVDGYLYDLFTGDENRYRVEMRDSNENLMFTWFVLPDEYSEPFTNTPVINISCTDGVGRLKGKFLPDEYYSEEKNIIDIITKCLSLTGIEMDLRFAPAIENYQQKEWETIYLPGRFFNENDKKQDAYSILEDITEGNILYQSNNRWNLEGINIREQRVYKAREYSGTGEYLQEVEITRNYKEINGIATPEIKMQPPYGVVEVTHEREPIELPEGLVEVDNDGWKNYDSFNDGVIALEWMPKNGFYAESQKEFTSYLALDNNNSELVENAFFGGRADNEDEQSIGLRKRPYIQKGKKYRINLNFEILPYSIFDEQEDFEQAIIDGYWTNPFLYSIRVGEVGSGIENIDKYLIYNNFFFPDTYRYRDIQFDSNFNSENEFTFIASRSGLLDISINPLSENNDISKIGKIKITEAQIENLDFEEELTSQSIINEDYTLKKEIDLEYSDGVTGVSKSYRLDKLDEANTSEFEQFTIIPIRQFEYNGQFYSSLKLRDANLIKENLRYSYANVVEADLIDVIYNFQESQEHVVVTDIQVSTFNVQVLDYNRVTYDRLFWEQWSDSLFKIEKNRYNDALVDIHKRMFDKPLATIQDFRVKTNVKIDDFIGFKWKNVKDWIITNCSWDVDAGFSNITISERYYTSNNPLLPPVVDVDVIQYYADTSAYVESEVYAPSGFVTNWQWEIIEGAGAVINAPNAQNTLVYIPTTTEYVKLKVTVTDNNGNTSEDFIELIKEFDVDFSVSEVSSSQYAEVWELEPIDIGENSVLNLKGSILARAWGDPIILFDDITAEIEQNGVVVSNVFIIFGTTEDQKRELVEEFSINYRKGDTIRFKINIADFDGVGEVISKFTLDYSEYIVGSGEIDGYPISKQIRVFKVL